jgi:Asp-tRNA(Asn)/Glu-tRNA(Gln) amidotransferase A subunit family amidase
MDVMVGEDTRDPDSRSYAAPDFRARLNAEQSKTPRFALMRTPMWDNADEDVRRGLEALAEKSGAKEIEMPVEFRAGWDAHRAIMAADMAFNLGAIADGGDVSQQFRELVAEGRKVTATNYLAAQRDARRYADSIAAMLAQDADAILTPSARGVAPKGMATGDPMFCSFWSLIGFPALNLPLLTGAGGLPIGVQLVGAPGSDARLLRNAKALLAKVA